MKLQIIIYLMRMCIIMKRMNDPRATQIEELLDKIGERNRYE